MFDETERKTQTEEYRELASLVSVLGVESAQEAADSYLIGLYVRTNQEDNR